MNFPNATISNKSKDRPSLLVLCLIFSLLLHLVAVFYLRYHLQSTENLIAQLQEPTIVQLVDKPPAIKKKEYELDQTPTKPAPKPPIEASRLAEQNQQVVQEMAPKGDDVRDQTAKPTTSQPSAPPPAEKPQPAKQQSQQASSPPKPSDSAKRLRQQEEATAEKPQQAQKPAPLPSLKQLTQLAPNTIGRIAKAERQRIKQRDDVVQGDTVWLNLEQGLLISFFRRFRNRIEGVWNYPQEAVYKKMQGTLLLKITVDREGELLDVDLMRSSGHELLDYEAIQAVYRAAPFGPLGKHYPHPDMKIMANFTYTISGKYIYGR